jgi:uncharacterized protein
MAPAIIDDIAMHTLSTSPIPIPGHGRLLLVAAALLGCYQLPQAAGNPYLMLLFPPLAWLGSRALGFRGMRAWYLDARPGWLRLLALGLGLAMVAKFAAFAVGTHTGVYELSWPGAVVGVDLARALAFLAISTFIASAAEDILTRGLVMRAFPRLGRHRVFILLSASLYVLNHIHRLQNGPAEWLMLFCFGLAYAAALWRTGTLWAAVGLHWGWNLAGGSLDIVTRPVDLQPDWAPFYSSGAHLVLLLTVLVTMRPADKA